MVLADRPLLQQAGRSSCMGTCLALERSCAPLADCPSPLTQRAPLLCLRMCAPMCPPCSPWMQVVELEGIPPVGQTARVKDAPP